VIEDAPLLLLHSRLVNVAQCFARRTGQARGLGGTQLGFDGFPRLLFRHVLHSLFGLIRARARRQRTGGLLRWRTAAGFAGR